MVILLFNKMNGLLTFSTSSTSTASPSTPPLYPKECNLLLYQLRDVEHHVALKIAKDTAVEMGARTAAVAAAAEAVARVVEAVEKGERMVERADKKVDDAVKNGGSRDFIKKAKEQVRGGRTCEEGGKKGGRKGEIEEEGERRGGGRGGRG